MPRARRERAASLAAPGPQTTRRRRGSLEPPVPASPLRTGLQALIIGLRTFFVEAFSVAHDMMKGVMGLFKQK
jgi:hypothetical protein